MKKFKALMLIGILVLSMATICSCSGKKCSQCGERVENGYTVMGSFVCKDCLW